MAKKMLYCLMLLGLPLKNATKVSEVTLIDLFHNNVKQKRSDVTRTQSLIGSAKQTMQSNFA